MRYLVLVFSAIAVFLTPCHSFAASQSNAPRILSWLERYQATEVKLRKILITSGFGIHEEFDSSFTRNVTPGTFLQSSSSDRLRTLYSTQHIISVLTSFDEFPEVKNKLTKGLAEASLPVGVRVDRLNGQAFILAAIAQVVYSEEKDGMRWETFLPSIMEKWTIDTSYSSETLRKDLPAKKALANKLMITLLELMDQMAPVSTLTATSHQTAPWFQSWIKPQHRSEKVGIQAEFFTRAVDVTLFLVLNRNNKTLLQKSERILAFSQSSPVDRLQAVLYLNDTPNDTIESLIVRAQYSDDLSAFNAMWESTYSKGLLLASFNDEFSTLEAALSESIGSTQQLPVLLQSNSTKKTATKIRLTQLATPPLAFTTNATLYMVFPLTSFEKESQSQLEKRLAQQGSPIFTHSFLASTNGPVCIQINPNNTTDAKLLTWYVTRGAALGQALLIASYDTQEEMAKHLHGWHFFLGQTRQSYGDTESTPHTSAKTNNSRTPQLLLAYPYEGSFLNNLLPLLDGKNAVKFMGKIETLWYAIPDKSGTVTWYTAKIDANQPSEPSATSHPAQTASTTSTQPSVPSTFAKLYTLALDANATDYLIKKNQELHPHLFSFHLSTEFFPHNQKSQQEAYAFYQQELPRMQTTLETAKCRQSDLPVAIAMNWLQQNAQHNSFDLLKSLTEKTDECSYIMQKSRQHLYDKSRYRVNKL